MDRLQATSDARPSGDSLGAVPGGRRHSWGGSQEALESGDELGGIGGAMGMLFFALAKSLSSRGLEL